MHLTLYRTGFPLVIFIILKFSLRVYVNEYLMDHVWSRLVYRVITKWRILSLDAICICYELKMYLNWFVSGLKELLHLHYCQQSTIAIVEHHIPRWL